MSSWSDRLEQRFAPARRRGFEYLDGNDVDPAVRRRSHRDIAVSNVLLGGSRAIAGAIDGALGAVASPARLLDVGAGAGETLALAMRLARRRNVALQTIALDVDEGLARTSLAQSPFAVRGCATALPFADRSIDIVVCSLLLHHFEGDRLRRVVRELDRVARHRVVIHDLRRSRVAAAGLWVLSFPLGFHPVSRHDGVTSVLRGFTRHELRSLVYDTVGAHPRVSRHLGFRLVVSWDPVRLTDRG